MAQTYPELDFRKKLFIISNQLGTMELSNLKFMVSQDLPTRRLELISTTFELLCALEDANLIGANDETLLKELLDCIQRGHLMNCRASSSPPTPEILLAADQTLFDRGSLTRSLLTPVANGLSQQDFRNLKCFFIKAGDPKLSYQELEEMSSPVQLFHTLMRQGVLVPGKLGLLWNILHTIGRNDLCRKIEEYHLNPPARTPTAESGGNSPGQLPLNSAAQESLSTGKNSMVFSPNNGENRSLSLPLNDRSSGEYSGESFTSGSFSSGTPLSPDGRFQQANQAASSLPGASIQPKSGFTDHPISDTPVHSATQQSSQPSSLHHRIVSGGKEFLVPAATQQPVEEQKVEEEQEKLKAIIVDQNNQIQRLIHQVHVLENNSSSTPSYPMQRKPHGLAIIISNEHFIPNPLRPNLKLGQRNGTDVDTQFFADTFRALGYIIQSHRNCTAAQIKEVVQQAVKVNHTVYDSFVLCFSTHGENNNFIFGSDSNTVNVYELVAMVQSCPTLQCKPKMFFIQACRVQVQVVVGDGLPLPALPIPHNPQADIFIAWATTRTHSAFRSPKYGSWFAAALYNVLTQYAHNHDLVSMMYKVNEVICSMEGEDKGSGALVQQCVEFSLQLRYSIKFFQESPN